MPPTDQELLPQVLSTCCSFCPEYSSPRYLHFLLPHFIITDLCSNVTLSDELFQIIIQNNKASGHFSTSKPSISILTHFICLQSIYHLTHLNPFNIFLSQLKCKFHVGKAMFCSLLYPQRPRIVPCVQWSLILL